MSIARSASPLIVTRAPWTAIAGFATGAARGGALYAAVGVESLALPVGLAPIALALPRHLRTHTVQDRWACLIDIQ
jgi:hypothetical protein